MSRAIKCDRCGMYTDENHGNETAHCTIETGSEVFRDEDRRYDLCKKCAEELEEFMRGRKENE